MMKEKGLIHKGWKVLLASLLLVMLSGMTSLAADATINMTRDEKSTNFYVSGGTYKKNTNVYNKIVVKKAGLLVVTGYSENQSTGKRSSLKVTLLNKKKKAFEKSSGSVAFEKGKYITYAVDKGTYYIKVTKQKAFGLFAEIQPVTDKGAATKKKAALIKAGTEVKGILCVGEKASRADWYKFKVTKSKVLKTTVSAESNGMFEFYVYGPSFPKGAKIASLQNQKAERYSTSSDPNKKLEIKPGTYYIKVNRASNAKKAFGSYSVKWQLQ